LKPKFRAWDKDAEVMDYQKDNGNDYVWMIGTDSIWVERLREENDSVPEQIIMQSTEMDDKTGKEIWHKDILDESYTSPLNGEEVIVRYIVEKENGMWRLKDWKGRQQYDRYLFMRNKQCVKIGNVFQNPELLEKANEN